MVANYLPQPIILPAIKAHPKQGSIGNLDNSFPNSVSILLLSIALKKYSYLWANNKFYLLGGSMKSKSRTSLIPIDFNVKTTDDKLTLLI